jgi:hypothetical protein
MTGASCLSRERISHGPRRHAYAEKPYKLFDERGLFMLVTRAGGRLWRFKYYLGGVEEVAHPGHIPRRFFEAGAGETG